MTTPIVKKDFAAKKITIEKSFAAPKSKVWRAWTDDSILIKWWGPKEWPAMNVSFDFREGGHWHYGMTGPDGTKVFGWIDYISITPEDSFTALDAFADEAGNKNLDFPSTHWLAEFQDKGESTTVLVTLTFSKEESMQTLIDMGFQEGFSDALDNLDTYLAQN